MPQPGGPQSTHAFGFEERTCTRCGELKGGSPFRFCKCMREDKGLGDKQPHGAPEFDKGDWIAEREGEQPQFGLVKQIFSMDNEWLVNLEVWNWEGEKIGRVSPPEGGPIKFEPACPAIHYAKIEKPYLPLDKRNFTLRGYRHLLKFV